MTKKREPPFAEVARLIKGYELTSCKLAKILGCVDSTAWIKLNEPDRFTLGDLKLICISGGVPADEIKAAIKFGQTGGQT